MASIRRRHSLHNQLYDVLREKIKSDMAPGDALPSERQLSERYGLSRTTVRIALADLEAAGLVVRRHGKGTFVSDAAQGATDLALCYSFTDEMRAMGKVPQTRIVSFGVVDATKEVSSALGVRLGTPVYDVFRLRSADGDPMLLGHSYLPVATFPNLTREEVATRSMYEIIEGGYGQRIASAAEEVRAGTAVASDARALGIAEGAAVLEIARVSTNTQGEKIEYTSSVARGDKFKYRMVHHRA
ncbi:MAG: GntR family transcriptional regulator [Parafannyhessea sp.]|uniref:GntR family transcriptional regulator n=1 Tax=Parafannyhessea sp. TaxID=2847324 RepID=UPI003F0E2787